MIPPHTPQLPHNQIPTKFLGLTRKKRHPRNSIFKDIARDSHTKPAKQNKVIYVMPAGYSARTEFASRTAQKRLGFATVLPDEVSVPAMDPGATGGSRGVSDCCVIL